MRSAVGRLKLDGSNKTVVTEWLKHLEETENRKRKWENGFNKIKNLFTNEDEIWNLLEAKDEKCRIYFNHPQELVSVTAILKNRLWSEAVKSLFDACARAHKRDIERKQRNREDQINGTED